MRAVSRIAADQGEVGALIVVVGSQAILASYRDRVLPEALTRSVEADVIVLTSNRADVDRFATLVDGAIGEASPFHQSYGYYGRGVGPETSIVPDGWADRLVPIHDSISGTTAYCLEPHDLCVAKLCAGRPKDLDYVQAALDHRLVDGATVGDRLASIDQPAARRAEALLARLDRHPLTVDERTTWHRNRAQALRDRTAGLLPFPRTMRGRHLRPPAPGVEEPDLGLDF